MLKFSVYCDSVRSTQESAKVLYLQLASALPADADALEKRRVAAVKVEAEAVVSLVIARQHVLTGTVGPARLATITAWSSAQNICAGKTRGKGPTAKAARDLQKKLFAHGVPVSKQNAFEVLGVSLRMLQRIDEEKLGKLFVQVIGEELFDEVKASTKELQGVIGADGEALPAGPESDAIQAQLVKFGRAVGAYCRALMAKVEDDDVESEQRFRSAVAPIDAMRASLRGHGEDSTIDTTATDPSAASDPSTTSSAPVTNGAAHA